MEKKALDDKKVLRVLRTLYQAVKKAAKKKKLLPMIGVFSVRFDDNGKVFFDVSGDTVDMNEAMRRVGVTVYQTFAGVSEFRDESYIVDGYDKRPLNTAYWSAISYLLSGSVNDMKSFEAMIGWKSALRRWLNERKAERAARKEALRQEQKAKYEEKKAAWQARQLDVKEKERALEMAGSNKFRFSAARMMAGWLQVIPEWLQLNKGNLISGLAMAFCLLEIVLFCRGNWAWAAPMVIAFCSLVFLIVILAEAWLWSWLQYRAVIRIPLILVAMFFYAMSSVYTVSFSLPLAREESRNLILIDRDSGALAARLPNDAQDSFLTWNEMAIPLARYRIEQGLPLNQKQQFELVFGDKELKFSAAFKLDAYYALIDETSAAYVMAWDYWRKPENLTIMVKAIFETIESRTRVEFEKEIAIYRSGAKPFGASEAKALFKKLDHEIRFYFHVYQGSLFCYSLTIAFTDTPYYNFAEARMSGAAVLTSDVVVADDADVHSE